MRKYSTESNHHITSCASPSNFFQEFLRTLLFSDIWQPLFSDIWLLLFSDIWQLLFSDIWQLLFSDIWQLLFSDIWQPPPVILHSCPRPDAVSPLQNCSRCSIVAIVTIGSAMKPARRCKLLTKTGAGFSELCGGPRANLPPSIAGPVSRCRVYFGFHM